MPSGNSPENVFHWGYVVANMDRAIKTWVGQGAELIVPPAIDSIQNVSCSLLVYQNAVPIELVAPLPGGHNPIKTRLNKGGGLDHVCLFSDELDADITKYERLGGVVVVPPCYGSVFDRRLAFVATRAGLVVELMARQAVGQIPTDPLAKYLSAGDW